MRAKSTMATSGSDVRRHNKRVRTSERLITEKLDRPNDPLPADGKTYTVYSLHEASDKPATLMTVSAIVPPAEKEKVKTIADISVV